MSSSEESFELTSSSIESSNVNNEDLLSSLPLLSDELEYFGLQPLPPVPADECGIMTSVVLSLIDSMWKFIHVHQSMVRQRDETMDAKHRLADDNKNLRTQIDYLKKELANKDKQLSLSSEREQRLNSNCDKLKNDLKIEKEEVRRLSSQISQRDSHHAHEMRKKEHEVLHVQEQLRHNLGLTRSVTYEENNHKQQENDRKSALETSSTHRDTSLKHNATSIMCQEQEDMYKEVIYKFERNNQALIQENTNLRDIFYKFHVSLGLLARRFAEFMEKNLCGDTNRDDAECKTELKIVPSTVFQMPYDDIREYNKELHEEGQKYVDVLELVLKKLLENKLP